jgi:flagellar motor switch protein FliN/FliY
MAANELSQDDIDALLNRAAERARTSTGVVPGDAAPSSVGRRPTGVQSALRTTRGAVSTVDASGVFEDLLDIPLELRVRLGEAVMQIEDIVALTEGSVVELDRASGDPVDVLANNRIIAKGEVVVVDDRFTVRVTEILAPEASAERK